MPGSKVARIPTPCLAILPVLGSLLVHSWLTCQANAQSYTPEHPRVQAMVSKGVNFLTTGTRRSLGGEYAQGGPMLVGYTLLKVTGDIEMPQVKTAIRMAVQLANNLERTERGGESKIVYEASVAAILLASVDSAKYQPELNNILYFFESIQKSHGGFGYLGRPTGDTSQVQYVMLALWTMHQVDMDVPVQIVESTINYLKSTMDPSGAWGYQGKLANGGRLVAQEKVSKSLATAGAGALIIGGDILGFYGKRKKKNDENEGIPDAFVRIDLKLKNREKRRNITLERSDTDGQIQGAVRYQNRTNFGGGYWYYYWRYSQERYESFVEVFNNKQEKSPLWYNQGVEELGKLQAADGSWGVTGKVDLTPPDVCTAFSILFLIRSTQKSIGKLDEGVTFGGYGLPTNLSSIRMVGDRIVSDEETSVENLLTMLENEEASDVEIGLLPEHLRITDDPTKRKAQIARLSRLLASRDYKARRVAAKLLGRTDDLGVVPDLIYALTDEDGKVPMIAEESLRLLSRKLNAGTLALNSTVEEKSEAEAFWKKWYLGLRPDFIFIDR